MKFIATSPTSETGKKLACLSQRINVYQSVLEQLAFEFQFKKVFTPARFIIGPPVKVQFKDGIVPDPTVWRKVSGGFVPRKKTFQGLQMYSRLKTVPIVTNDELNRCINYYGDTSRSVGFDISYKYVWFIMAGDDWNFSMPEDCQQVTEEYYNQSVLWKKVA